MRNELAKIIDMGFDGARFDNVDSCKMWENPEDYGLNLPRIENASVWVINLVKNLSAFAKSLRPDFIITVNMGGALDLLDNETFMECIDAVEREEVWYSDNNPIEQSETNEVLYWLRHAKNQGKIVMVMDYAWDEGYVRDAISKAREEEFYIYVAPSYNLDSIPSYIPIFHGIDVVSTPEPLLIWSYHGPTNNEWCGEFDIYIGRLLGNSVKYVKRISSDFSNDEPASGAYNPESDIVLVAWETDEDTNYTWVKGALINPDTLQTITYIEIAEDDVEEVSQHSPDVVYFNNSFYVFYVNETLYKSNRADIYCAVVNSEGNVTQLLSIATTDADEFYPVATASENGVLVIWFHGGTTDKLYAALIIDDDVVWKKVIGTDVKPYRYGVIAINEGYMVIYQTDYAAKAVVINENGNIITSIDELPDITWEPGICCWNESIVAYTGIKEVHFLRIDGTIKYIGSKSLKYPSSAGVALLKHNNTLYAIEPLPHGNNTLEVTILYQETEGEELLFHLDLKLIVALILIPAVTIVLAYVKKKKILR